jgi:hypothetical protein
MNDPDLEQIGAALVDAARGRAARRPVRARRLRYAAAGALAVATLLLVVSTRGGGGSDARAEDTGFTQYAVVYRGGGSRVLGCAVARCAAIDAGRGRRVTSVELVAIARNVTSARVVGVTRRATSIPSTAGSRPIVLESPASGALIVELLDAKGRVVQTLRE